MAMPIRETPVLKGKDADRFVRQIERNKDKPVSRKHYEIARNTYLKIMKKRP